MIRKTSYTDSEKFQIMRKQYPDTKDYKVGNPIIINDNNGDEAMSLKLYINLQVKMLIF